MATTQATNSSGPGDAEAFAALRRRHAGWIGRFLRSAARRCGDWALFGPEDLAQIADEALWRAAAGFRPERGIHERAWCRVAVATALGKAIHASWAKARRPQGRVGLGAAACLLDASEPLQAALDREAIAAVLRAAAELAPEERAALAMLLTGHSTMEAARAIATARGLQQWAGWKRLDRARELMREEFRQEGWALGA